VITARNNFYVYRIYDNDNHRLEARNGKERSLTCLVPAVQPGVHDEPLVQVMHEEEKPPEVHGKQEVPSGLLQKDQVEKVL